MRNHSKPNGATRRDFLKTAGALGAGIYTAGASSAAGAQGKVETLAMNGGPKAVAVAEAGATKWPIYGKEEIKLVSELLLNPSYGPVAEFEKAWQTHFDCPYVKAHCNGTSALTSMLFALDYPEGSEILVPDYSTWFPVVPMRLFGLVPVFVDVNPRTLNIDVEDCKKRITPRTKAIMPVHWYGLPCDMDDVQALADEHGLDVVEDASHSHGAKVKGKWTGNWGRMAGFSMQMGKPLPSIEGGIGVYKDARDFERATTYGNYDLPHTFPEDSPYRKYQGTAFGSKLRIHPASAIVARIQLGKLDEFNRIAVSQIKTLNDRITQLPGLSAQYVRPDIDRVFYSKNLMFIDEKKANAPIGALIKALKAEGVGVAKYNWTLLHTYPLFSESQYWRHMPVLPDKVPGCDVANKQVISMPVFTSEHPELVEQYAKAFEKVWAHRDGLA